MKYPFTYEEGSLLVRLIIAHILTDFFLQTKKGIENKKNKLLKSRSLWLHILYTGVLAALVMGRQMNWFSVLLITLSHLAIDYAKLLADKKIKDIWPQKEAKLFVIDQLLHLLILVVVWLIIISGYQKLNILIHQLFPNYRILLRLLGYLIVVAPVTYVIKFLTSKWLDEVFIADYSLADAGKWIGILERIIVVTLIYIGQFTAIGFLIAAKSILRLIDKPELPDTKSFSSRKHTEYVLIGTWECKLNCVSRVKYGIFKLSVETERGSAEEQPVKG